MFNCQTLKVDFNKPKLTNNGFNCYCGFPDIPLNKLPVASQIYGENDFYGFDGKMGYIRFVHPDNKESLMFGVAYGNIVKFD